MTHAKTLTVADLAGEAAWARRLARALVGAGDADDLVQETWLAALDARPDTDQPVRRWLRTVLRHRAFNHRRDDARLRARHQAAAVASPPSPEELLGRMEVQRLLAEAVVALSEPLRQTVLLRYYEELKSPEIAQLMGVADGTVRRRLKEALDELKQRLDGHHGRDAWLRALLPLAPIPRTGRSVLLKGAIGVVGIVAIGTSAVMAVRRHEVVGSVSAAASFPRPTGPLGAMARASGGSGGSNRAPVAFAAASGSLDECLRQLIPLRVQVGEAESKRRRKTDDITLFSEGTPNSVAQAALRPDVDRLLKPFGPTTTYSLECRTWNCRITLLVPAGSARTGAWEAIQRDPQLRPRLRGGSLVPGKPAKDAVSGTALDRYDGYVRLADPSGKLVAVEIAVPVAAVETPPPTTASVCMAELEAGKKRLGELNAFLRRAAGPAEAFATGRPDPAASARLKAIIARILAVSDPAWSPDVECRGTACRISVPGLRMLGETARDWKARIFSDPEFRRHTAPPMDVGADGLYVTLFPDPSRPLGEPILRQVRDAWKGSAGLAGCSARYAETGDLTATFDLTDGVHPPDGKAPGELTISWSGSLVGTVLARCVQDEATSIVAAAKVPERVRPATIKATVELPLPGR
jgi:RNA polymerase sigma-70 factor (ECF subfamily)